jgi:ComF family protein
MAPLAILLPTRCGACGLPGSALCERCRALLVRVGTTGCARCGAPGHWPVERCAECVGRRLAFAQARAALVYDDRTRRLVGQWKEHGRRDLTRRLADLVVECVTAPAADSITFVPGDRERGLKRGHVPAEGLSRALGRAWSIPATALLARTAVGETKRQASLPRAARRSNVRGAFRCRAEVPLRVVLVDDVYTTGATVAACATELRRAGAGRVEVVCLARAVR